MTHYFILSTDSGQKTIGKTTSRNLSRALVFRADKEFGLAQWKVKKDLTITGFYAVAPNGNCLMLSPTSVSA